MERNKIMFSKIEETADFLASRMGEPPEVGMITGTGLGSLTDSIVPDFRLPYEEIPHFPKSTVEGHKGTLVGGKFGGRSVVALEGRFHLYEGYTSWEVTFPVRVMAMLGIRFFLMSSAAGGLNPSFKKGDLMIVTDHINLKGVNPLTGPNLAQFGPRFPDMSQVYAPELIGLAREKAMQSGLFIREGVYVGVPGPSLETPAETRFLRTIGADAVGMSTVSQAIVAAHCGLKTLAIVVITNVNIPDCMGKTTIEEVIEASKKASPVLSNIWEKIIIELPEGRQDNP